MSLPPERQARLSALDPILGARAAGALLLLAGDLDEAQDALSAASSRYLEGLFFLRLALVTPGVSLRLAWRVARRRLFGPRSVGPP